MTQAATNAPEVSFRGAGLRIGDTDILHDVSFEAAPGQQIALIGPSGAGKTTLLRLCAGVLWPGAGEVEVLGRTIGNLDPHQLCKLRKEIGFLRQSDNLIPGLRVCHNVLMGNLGRWSILRSLVSLFWPQDLAAARAALGRVELGDRLWSLPGALSGGEQQRVAIARLLVQQPRLLLADEPVSSLDIRLGRDVVRLLSALARERGSTLLVSLHTLDLLREGFDRVIALRQGRVHWQGRPDQLTRGLLKEVYGAEYQALHLDELELDGNGAAP
jgi:phosphonate transport system ATP-binding protein